MESFTKLFGSLRAFVYHCFDRIVTNGYLEHLARPGQVVYFFRDGKIAHRKDDNAFLAVADPVALQEAADRLTAEVIRKSLDYWTLIVGPKFSKREQKVINVRRAYYIHQIEYCRNFIFKRNFPIHKIFERSCDFALWRMTAHKVSEMFGVRLTRQHQGKLHAVMDQIEHGHHVSRAYWKQAFIKQYEKFSTYLRNEICSNNLSSQSRTASLGSRPSV